MNKKQIFSEQLYNNAHQQKNQILKSFIIQLKRNNYGNSPILSISSPQVHCRGKCYQIQILQSS